MDNSEVKEICSFITGTVALVFIGLLIAFTLVTSVSTVHEYISEIVFRSKEHRQIETNIRREMRATHNKQRRSE